MAIPHEVLASLSIEVIRKAVKLADGLLGPAREAQAAEVEKTHCEICGKDLSKLPAADAIKHIEACAEADKAAKKEARMAVKGHTLAKPTRASNFGR